MGVPMVDGVNSLILASRATDAPMRFVNFKQKKGQPQTPTALVADTSSESVFGVAYYRDDSLALRTPTKDGVLYNVCSSLCCALLDTDKLRWANIRLAQPLFEDFKLRWGFDSYVISNPSDSIFPASSSLDIPQYVEQGSHLLDSDYTISEQSFVQYAPRKDDDKVDGDFQSFFGGNLYYDKKIGPDFVSYQVAPSSSSSLMMDGAESITSESGDDNIDESHNDCNFMKLQRRKSW